MLAPRRWAADMGQNPGQTGDAASGPTAGEAPTGISSVLQLGVVDSRADSFVECLPFSACAKLRGNRQRQTWTFDIFGLVRPVVASEHWTSRAAVLFPNLQWGLFGHFRRGIRPCRQGRRLDGNEQGLRRSGRRHCPQAETAIGMANGASGRVPKAGVQNPRPGRDAGPFSDIDSLIAQS